MKDLILDKLHKKARIIELQKCICMNYDKLEKNLLKGLSAYMGVVEAHNDFKEVTLEIFPINNGYTMKCEELGININFEELSLQTIIFKLDNIYSVLDCW